MDREYVRQAPDQGSGNDIALEGNAVPEVSFGDNALPAGDDRLATGASPVPTR